MTKKICSLALICIFTILVSLLGGTSVAYAADDDILFDQTYVLDDLKGSAVDGVTFSVDDYPYDPNGEIEVLGFVEYGYSAYANMQDNYGLYIYLYNPALLDISDSTCQIQIGIGDSASSADTYNKYYLQVVSRSEGTEQNRFLKMKVLGAENFVDELDPAARRYFVSGIEIMCYGSSTITEYNIGKQFVFSGYSKGYSEESENKSTLNIQSIDLENIIISGLLDRQTVYRDNMDNPNVTSHNQVNGVYFALDEKYFNDYGGLQRIKAEWYEYRTEPIIVVDDQTAYDSLYSARGVNVGVFSNDFPYGVYAGVTTNVEQTGLTTQKHDIHYAWAWNCFNGYKERMSSSFHYSYKYTSDTYSPVLGWIIKGEGDIMNNYVVPESVLKSYRNEYESQFKSSVVTDGTTSYSSHLFNNNVGSGRKAGYNVYEFDAQDDIFVFTDYGVDPSTYNLWQDFKSIFGWTAENEVSLNDQSPFLIIDSENYNTLFAGETETIAERLLIDVSEVEKFKNYCDTQIAKGNKVVHFRFACTEYFARFASVIDDKGSNALSSTIGNAFVAAENVFLNFDVISLTFKNDNGDYRVIPVVNDPIDVISGIVGPTEPPDLGDEAKTLWDEFVEAMKAFFASIFGTAEDWKKFLYIVLGVVAAIVVIWIIVKVVGLFGGSKKSETVIKIDPSMYRDPNKRGK